MVQSKDARGAAPLVSLVQSLSVVRGEKVSESRRTALTREKPAEQPTILPFNLRGFAGEQGAASSEGGGGGGETELSVPSTHSASLLLVRLHLRVQRLQRAGELPVQEVLADQLVSALHRRGHD